MVHSAIEETRSSQKPTKPVGCPLTPSGGGSWVKKINGRVFTFGPWQDLTSALKKYYAELDFINENGYQPSTLDLGKVTVEDMANRFLAVQYERADAVESADQHITNRHYNDLLNSCTTFVTVVGKRKLVEALTPTDFGKVYKVFSEKRDKSLASPATIAGHVRRTKAMLNWAYDSLLIDTPVRTGKQFKVPSRKTFRKHRNGQPQKIFTAAEIHGMICHAPLTIKAAIWLGINCGLSNSDVGHLPASLYLNRESDWIHYPRSKTGVYRKLPLWPETITAIDEMLAQRVQANTKVDGQHLFLTSYGNRFQPTTISTEVQKLKKKLSIVRQGCGFNSLRHCVETHGGIDQTAINVLMGHVDSHISAEYRELVHFSNQRLLKVTSTIRKWLGEHKKQTALRESQIE